MRKLNNAWTFFLSVLPINFVLSLAGLIMGGTGVFMATLLGIGFIASVAIFEVRNRNQYQFYRNNGLTRMVLWLSAYAFTTIFGLLAVLIFILIRR